MQLKSIRLSGFKSFADSTLLPFKAQICSVVGPNGCGKSNIVDAIRWVVGEGSAKQLRMQSMADVIFNGTNNRKPMGMASVELNFDNSDHSLVGEYAHYTELSVKRVVERDGASNYYINNTPCRRRDIIDIFLGTGLGPRSYAIIEQGMISRLIEAKDQELRAYLEEAAGVSKYKERRRETENRLRHTNENLERLQDIIDEHGKQQRHLKRQANSAERYKVLKAEQRVLSAECLAIEHEGFAEQISKHDAKIAEAATEQAAKKSTQAALDNEITQERENHETAQTQAQKVQKEYYAIGSEVAKLEQQISHYRSQYTEWQNNLQQLLEQSAQIDAARAEYSEKITKLEQESSDLAPRRPELVQALEDCNKQLDSLEQQREQWREKLQDYQVQISDKQREISVCEAKKQHADADLRRLDNKCQQLKQTIQRSVDSDLESRIEKGLRMQSELDAESSASSERAEQLRTEIEFARDSISAKQDALNELQQQLQSAAAREQALQVILDNAVDQDQQSWLNENGLGANSKLTQELSIAPGWEHAVEAVLAPVLGSVCVDNCNDYKDLLAQSKSLRLYVNSTSSAAKSGTLAACVNSDCIPVELNYIYTADSAAQAWAMLDNLSDSDSVITKDCLWISKSWARSLRSSQGENNSQILCTKEIKEISARLPELAESSGALKLDIEHENAKMREMEANREEAYQDARNSNNKLKSVNENLSRLQAECEEQKRSVQSAREELCICQNEINDLSTAELESAMNSMQSELETIKSNKQEHQLISAQLRDDANDARVNAQNAKQAVDEFELRLSSNAEQLALLKTMSERDNAQSESLNERVSAAQSKLDTTDSPLPAVESALQEKIKLRVDIESSMRRADAAVSEINTKVRDLESALDKARRAADQFSNEMQKLQMQRQEHVVRQATVKEQFDAGDFQLSEVLENLSADANLTEWKNRLEAKEKSISRLGPINMAAIEEYDAITERKEYLDSQNTDLLEAIKLLEQAIDKIDRQTKDKFKETFNAANANLQQLFPKVFNGGRAYLELTEPDWLNAGVVIRAQPPGKKNSTIHMLSGGEKALTAISLVFSLFSLNPAPFCVLDEVDAPLDDSNVARFCRLVKEMSEKTQFIVVSHNKVSINMAQQLLGVTMQEPGVSRLVAVNMDDAVAMAEA
jgi:chromosome segregation protein